MRNADFRKKRTAGIYIFLVLVVVPVMTAAMYYWLVASDIYVSEAQFSVYSSDDSRAMQVLGDLNLGSALNTNTKDLLIVKEYILSRGLLENLQKDIDLKAMYSRQSIDPLARLGENPTEEEFLNFYRKMVDVEVYREASLVFLKVRAFSGEDAYTINRNITVYTEKFINELSSRMKQDALRQSREILEDVEQDIVSLKERFSAFRQENKLLDPIKEVELAFGVIAALETQRAELIAHKSLMEATLQKDSYEIKAKEKEIESISAEVENIKNELLEKESGSTKMVEEFELLSLEDEFAKKKYELALFNMEETYRSLKKQNKYIVHVLKPTFPEYATEPERLRGVLSVFFIAFLGLSLAGLAISGINDHMI